MDKNYSVILKSNLPAFIKDDPSYEKFNQFFESYYDWFYDTYNVTGLSDKIDIDAGYADFLEYFKADFLPYFPKELATDKTKLIKIIREFYKAKGIPNSFKFLFRALYDCYVEVTPTRDFVFKASDGKWIVPKSIKIKSSDVNFLKINNFKIFGLQSKTTGIIESSKYNEKYIQIYLSNIERLYYSGEPITILDINDNQVYYVDNQLLSYPNSVPPQGAIALTSKIIGSLSSVNINPTYRGQQYKVGDPIVIVGGLNPEIQNPVKAIGHVSEVTLGQINNVVVKNGGYGFTLFPNTSSDVVYAGAVDTVANVIVNLVDTSAKPGNIAFVPLDSIANSLNITIGAGTYNTFPKNLSANANVSLQNIFSFITPYNTYPISDFIVVNGGGGYETLPTLDVESVYHDNTTNSNNHIIKDLGILAPIQIANGGIGYTINDNLSIVGGNGHFAYANVTSVAANGSILSVDYVTNGISAILGGMGYRENNLPSIQITSSGGTGASLIIPGILGSGLTYSFETDQIGAITKIALRENGEDYIQTPNISLRIQDIAVSNVFTQSSGIDIVAYQGSSLQTSTFSGYVDSIIKIDDKSLSTFSDDVYNLRTYDYKGLVTAGLPIILYDNSTETILTQFTFENTYQTTSFTDGLNIYGDGSAKAIAKFLNGLIIGDGRYLNTDGQPSAFSYFQDDTYNLSTYFLSSEKDYSEYQKALFGLLHPSGSKIVPKFLMRTDTKFDITNSSNVAISNSYVTSFNVYLKTTSNNFSNTLIANSNTSGILSGDKIIVTTYNNMNVYSTVKSVVNNAIYLDQNIQYKYINIFSGYIKSNVVTLLDSNFTNPLLITKYSANTFAFVGDSVIINGSNYGIIKKTNNVLTISTSITPTGYYNIGIIKALTSNAILKQTSV